MNGLLGSGWDDPRTAATLQLAAGLLGPGGTMQRFAGGMSGYQGVMAQAKKEEEARRIREQQLQMMQLQMQQAQAKAEAEKQALAKAAAVENAYRQAFVPAATQATADGRGPTVGNLQKLQQARPQVDQQRLIAELAKIDPVAAFQMALPKETEIKEFREIRMPDGSVQVVGFGKDGKPVQTGQTPFKAPEVRDFGGYVGGIDPITGKVSRFGDKTQTPDSVASLGVQIRGQNMQDARARERLTLEQGMFTADAGGPGQMALVKQLGKPPVGYRWKPDGSMEAVPGGPADIKAGEAGAKAAARAEAGKAQANDVLETVKEAKGLVGYGTAGIGGLTAAVPATPGRDLQAKLTTIKANLGFDRLQQMRDMSPTGGALGQVAVQELQSLQATVASLDQLQSPGDLRKALDKIERHYKRWQDTLGGASGGASGEWGAKPAQQRSIDDLLKKYGN